MTQDFNYTDKSYSNGWTVETIDSYMKYKVYWYLRTVHEKPYFKDCCSLIDYIGFTGEEYWEWLTNDRIHSRITRIWKKPDFDWTKDV